MTHEGSILIVEDDDDVREALAVYFELEGYSVVQAHDGAEALQLLRSSTTVCIILLDLFMPVMNGFEFRAEQLRDPALANVPVVVVSADVGTIEKAAALGAVDSIVKPIDFGRLRQTIAQHC
jgi:CheY-like chemotaxis protein